LIFPALVAPANASTFQSSPPDVGSFRRNLENSIVEVKCGTTYSVGFAGNYTITPAMKDKGQNSLILTTGTGIANCRSSLKSAQISYKGVSSIADTQFQNGSNPDFASIITSVNIPPLQLYGTTLPESGWWVDVVRSVPGFGLVWESSHIKFVNSEKLTFTIDQITPGVVDNALVFANDGQFIGMLSSFGTTPIMGQVVVQGAPLQCQLSKSNSSPTVTICGKLASEIWVAQSTVVPTTTPKPTPSATKIAQPIISQENYDALLESNTQLKSQIASLQAQVNALIAIQSKYKQVCGGKVKPKGC